MGTSSYPYPSNMKNNVIKIRNLYNSVHGAYAFQELMAKARGNTELVVATNISQIQNGGTKDLNYAIKVAEVFGVDMNKFIFGEIQMEDLGSRQRIYSEIKENETVSHILWYMGENNSDGVIEKRIKFTSENAINIFKTEIETTTYTTKFNCMNELDNSVLLTNSSNKKMFLKFYKAEGRLVERQLSYGYIIRDTDDEFDIPVVSKCVLAIEGGEVSKFLKNNAEWIKGFLRLKNDVMLFNEEGFKRLKNKNGIIPHVVDLITKRNLYYEIDVEMLSQKLMENLQKEEKDSFIDLIIEAGSSASNPYLDSFFYSNSTSNKSIVKRFSKFSENYRYGNNTEEKSFKNNAESEDSLSAVCKFDPFIAIATSQNGVFEASWLSVDHSKKLINYNFDLNKKSQSGELPDFTMFHLDLTPLIISEQIELETGPLKLKFHYKTEFPKLGTLTIEFKYTENLIKIFEDMVSLDSSENDIDVMLPNLSKSMWDDLREICFVFRPSMINEKEGKVQFCEFRIEKINVF